MFLSSRVNSSGMVLTDFGTVLLGRQSAIHVQITQANYIFFFRYYNFSLAGILFFKTKSNKPFQTFIEHLADPTSLP